MQICHRDPQSEKRHQQPHSTARLRHVERVAVEHVLLQPAAHAHGHMEPARLVDRLQLGRPMEVSLGVGRVLEQLPVAVAVAVRRLDLAAVRLGADALGFNFWPRSKRYLPPAEARAIVRRLPAFVTAVGVFVDPAREEVLRAADTSGISVAQLHGDEPPAFCASLPLPVLKAIRLAGPHSLALLAAYEVQGFLLDAPAAGYGGSGTTCDWSLAAEVARGLLPLPYRGVIDGEAAEQCLDPMLLAAVIRQESRFTAKAVDPPVLTTVVPGTANCRRVE